MDFLDGGAAVVAELIGHGPKLLLDNVHELLFVVQNGFQFGDGFQKLGVFLAQGQNFQPGQALETHVQNGLRLDLRQTEALHQARLGRLGVLAFADQLDHFIQIVHGDHQALQNVGTCLGLVQLVLGAGGDDVLPVADVVADHPAQAQ